MEDYRIFELEDSTKVELIGTQNKYHILDPLFKLTRSSISEGIFESKLAERAGCDMTNGNLYIIYSNNYSHQSYFFMYIHCDDEYMYFGTHIK